MKTDNELIAEFMGALKKQYETEGMKCWVLSGGGVPVPGWYYQEHDIKYSTSWDWLMPVVEKIEKFEFDDGELDEGDKKDTAFLRTFKGGMVRFNRFTLHHCETKIEAMYMAVVEFIKWYNEQKK